MAGIARPAWTRRTHPIVRYEAIHWAHSRAWRLVCHLIWGGSLTFILVPAACAVLFSLESRLTTPAEAILGLGGVFSVGLALLTVLGVWFSDISASVISATQIARERESQTWPILRLTNLTSLDILGGKLMALFYTLLRPLQLITALRLLALIAALVTLVLAYLASGLTPRELSALIGPLFQQFSLTRVQWWGLGVLAGLSVLWAAVAWLAEPWFGLLYYGVIGLTVSSLSRSRGTAIVLMVAAHFCLALGLYTPAGQLGSLLLAPLAATRATDRTALGLVVLTLVLQFALQTLLPWAVMATCAVLTLRRLESLSD